MLRKSDQACPGRTPVHVGSMSLAELRAYRQDLLAEDDRATYWRSLVHARFELERAGGGHEPPLNPDQVAAALRATGADSRRRVFDPITSEVSLPHLPALEQFWTHAAGGRDSAGSLDQLDAELDVYRRAVRCRLDEATHELVERYRLRPTDALALLPVLEDEDEDEK